MGACHSLNDGQRNILGSGTGVGKGGFVLVSCPLGLDKPQLLFPEEQEPSLRTGIFDHDVDHLEEQIVQHDFTHKNF